MAKQKLAWLAAAAVCFVAAVNWLWLCLFYAFDNRIQPDLLLANIAIWPAAILAIVAGKCLWKAI